MQTPPETSESDWKVLPLDTDNIEEGNDAFKSVSCQGTFRGGENADYIEAWNMEDDSLEMVTTGETLILVSATLFIEVGKIMISLPSLKEKFMATKVLIHCLAQRVMDMR